MSSGVRGILPQQKFNLGQGGLRAHTYGYHNAKDYQRLTARKDLQVTELNTTFDL